MTDSVEQQKMEIACRFKKFREDLKITQKELGRLLQANQSSIAAVEAGEVFPALSAITFLYENYDLSLTWLLTGEGNMRLSPDPIELIMNRLPPAFEDCKEEAAYMIYCVENVPLVRYYMLSEFILFHFKNKERIEDYLYMYDDVD